MSDMHPSETNVVERHYRRGDIDFCFAINRQHRHLRVFDYRVGNYQQKREFLDSVVQTEGLCKVFTVVEKQDSRSWRAAGFVREGSIPGYFRTADAYVMSRLYDAAGRPLPALPRATPSFEIPTQKKVAEPAKKICATVIRDEAGLMKIGLALGQDAPYAPFRRTDVGPDLAAQAQIGDACLRLTAEIDDSFAHAKIDFVELPSTEQEAQLGASCLIELLAALDQRGIAAVFAMCSSQAKWTQQLLYGLGFRVTACLDEHLQVGDERLDLQVWHKRLRATQTHGTIDTAPATVLSAGAS